ncbi:MAG: ribonuclease III [Candidatus Liptonbacteria bacterium]|nr:ribonuclease III [Candidatus Liptonbacteria bacterium]
MATPLERTIGHTFTNERLLREAMTHRSYINENPAWDTPHNERLEFLGDAVLELAITERLYTAFPQETEGAMTSLRAALVNHSMLSSIARTIDLDASIRLSRGEAKDTGRARDMILADAVEALIGALYVDGGYEAAKRFVDAFVYPHIDEVMTAQAYKDPKSTLQERVQERERITPIYRVLAERGPDHDRMFDVGVYVDNRCVGRGTGHSKQEAETEAARNALQAYDPQGA